jgi:hypothetical protein
MGINRPNLCDKRWVYVPEKQYLFCRIGFWHNFAPSMVPTTALFYMQSLQFLTNRNKLFLSDSQQHKTRWKKHLQ